MISLLDCTGRYWEHVPRHTRDRLAGVAHASDGFTDASMPMNIVLLSLHLRCQPCPDTLRRLPLSRSTMAPIKIMAKSVFVLAYLHHMRRGSWYTR